MKEIELDKYVQIIPEQKVVDANGIPTGQKTEPVKLWGKFFNVGEIADIVLETICDPGITPSIKINPVWTFKNKAGVPMTKEQAGVPNNNASAILVETGTIVDLSATWLWREVAGYRNPTSTRGIIGGTDLMQPNVPSGEFIRSSIKTNESFQQTIICPKTGPIVNGPKILRPSGEHTATDSVSVTFLNKAFIGQIDTLTPNQNQIKGLQSLGLKNNKVLNQNGVTNDNNNYWCYAYPKSYGLLSKIIMNGATPVLNAFRTFELVVTNNSGDEVPYICYITNNKGAFTNAQLSFS